MPKLPTSAKKRPTMSVQRLGWMHAMTVQFIYDNGLGEKYREHMREKGDIIRGRKREKRNGD